MARARSETGKAVPQLDAATESALLQQMRGVSEQEAAALVMQARVDAATRAIEEADAIAREEQALEAQGMNARAARAMANTGSQMVRRVPQQAPALGPAQTDRGVSTSARAYATPYTYPSGEGQVPLRESPGFVEHEARLWDQGLRSSMPLDEPDPDEDFEQAFSRLRGRGPVV